MGSLEGDVSAECYPTLELSSPNKNLIAVLGACTAQALDFIKVL